MTWMIYGANGYTGHLLARLAAERGERPILAGRHPQRVLDVARELGLEARVFSLGDEKTARSLSGVDAVVHCAGPFIDTAAPMLAACRMAGTHYLDITGEIDVFEALFKDSERIRDSGITAVSGVGFDVVPSDCLAARLKERMPDARRLLLAFHPGRGHLSPGTTKTALRKLGSGRIRRDGKIIEVGPAHDVRQIPFRKTPSLAVTIPWGDVSTAYHSTGIPDIAVYMGVSRGRLKQIRSSRWLGPLTHLPGVQAYLARMVERKVKGPTDQEREEGGVVLWGQVEDRGGRRLALRMHTPDGYSLTAESALAAVKRILAGGVPKGALTPSTAFGADFAESLPGVSLEDAPTLAEDPAKA